jgi:hypothetical protein
MVDCLLHFVSNFLNRLLRIIITLEASVDPHQGVNETISINTTVADHTANEMFFSPACTRGTSDGGRIDRSIVSLFDRSPEINVLYLTVCVMSRKT